MLTCSEMAMVLKVRMINCISIIDYKFLIIVIPAFLIILSSQSITFQMDNNDEERSEETFQQYDYSTCLCCGFMVFIAILIIARLMRRRPKTMVMYVPQYNQYSPYPQPQQPQFPTYKPPQQRAPRYHNDDNDDY